MLEDLQQDGYTVLPSIISAECCKQIAAEVATAMQTRTGDAIEAGKGRVVGGRNLLSIWDGWRKIVSQPTVKSLIRNKLGTSAGAVRILFFDKPPGQGWSLSMHKDRTIAVKQHVAPPAPFAKPTTKAGVPHVEASEELLQRMLTLRLHLDPMHDNNGPLVVIPGSHKSQRSREIETIHCGAGDVFAMQPLLSHGSRAAHPETTDHRRVVHIELSAERKLPGRYEWHQFQPIDFATPVF